MKWLQLFLICTVVVSRVNTDECPICRLPIYIYSISLNLNCTHSFHLHCICRWLSGRLDCPVCRAHAGRWKQVLKREISQLSQESIQLLQKSKQLECERTCEQLKREREQVLRVERLEQIKWKKEHIELMLGGSR